MATYGPDERALFEDDATKLYEEICQHGGIPASDYRIADGGELRVAFVTWVEVAGGARCRVPEVVDDEKIGGEGAAAVVTLAALGVDADLHA